MRHRDGCGIAGGGISEVRVGRTDELSVASYWLCPTAGVACVLGARRKKLRPVGFDLASDHASLRGRRFDRFCVSVLPMMFAFALTGYFALCPSPSLVRVSACLAFLTAWRCGSEVRSVLRLQSCRRRACLRVPLLSLYLSPSLVKVVVSVSLRVTRTDSVRDERRGRLLPCHPRRKARRPGGSCV